MLKLLVLVLALSVLSPTAQAASKAQPRAKLDIGCAFSLSIGMPKAMVIAALSESCNVVRYKVEGDQGRDRWVVAGKGVNGKAQGLIEFESGYLAEASREWSPDSGRADDFAKALVLAMDSISSNSSTTATVKQVIKHGPDTTFFSLSIILPNHRQLQVELLEDLSSHRTIVLDLKEAIVK